MKRGTYPQCLPGSEPGSNPNRSDHSQPFPIEGGNPIAFQNFLASSGVMPQFRPLTDFAIEGCFEALSWLNAVLAGTLFAGGYSIAILYWPVGVPLDRKSVV